MTPLRRDHRHLGKMMMSAWFAGTAGSACPTMPRPSPRIRAADNTVNNVLGSASLPVADASMASVSRGSSMCETSTLTFSGITIDNFKISEVGNPISPAYCQPAFFRSSRICMAKDHESWSSFAYMTSKRPFGPPLRALRNKFLFIIRGPNSFCILIESLRNCSAVCSKEAALRFKSASCFSKKAINCAFFVFVSTCVKSSAASAAIKISPETLPPHVSHHGYLLLGDGAKSWINSPATPTATKNSEAYPAISQKDTVEINELMKVSDSMQSYARFESIACWAETPLVSPRQCSRSRPLWRKRRITVRSVASQAARIKQQRNGH